jgi:titin
MKKTFLLLLTIFIINFSYSAVFTVTTTSDAGAGSLREAINAANSNAMDADSIKFNIPTSDLNFNATTGVFTITLLSVLPTINSISVVIDGTSQPGNTNPNGPEIQIKSNLNLLYAFCFPFSGGVAKGFIINGFQAGIIITKYLSYPSGSCIISDCYIGVNHNASAADSNDIGIAIVGGPSGNMIKNNILSGNYTAGIAIRNAASNTIQGNKIGVDRMGTNIISNYYGIALDSASYTTIGGNDTTKRNIISGNRYAGIAINNPTSFNNTIQGNYIGINKYGLTPADSLPNYYGIAINNSHNNVIGGSTNSERNIISGNKEGGIAIMGVSSTQNSIKGNYIGTNILANDTIANGNGVLISGSSLNTIGGSVVGDRNIISGNRLAGIVLVYSGTRNNTIKGNYIGVGANGNKILSNYTGVYLKSNANSNTIGGSTSGERNIISGNIEMGLCMEASDSNLIIGNYIGPDATGLIALKRQNDSLVQANGLYFNSNSKNNIAGGYTTGERNVISGNRVYGHDIYGHSSNNYTIGNYIGVDATGNTAMPNATGICVDGGSYKNPFINNVLSGNLAYGIFIVTTGSDSNVVKGNFIGTNATGTGSIPNQSGILLGGGTKYNIIGGDNLEDKNILSGNTFDGILLADTGTSYNLIVGNFIGTDITGNYQLPNDIGIGVTTKSSNTKIDKNLISGNTTYGIVVFEHSNFNQMTRNKIGVNPDTTSDLHNGKAGIVITQGSSNNRIGGANLGNIIANHDTVGVVINDANCIKNTISENRIYNNKILDIDLYPYGVNANDPGDLDNGANNLMNSPTILSANYTTGFETTQINGTLDYTNPINAKVEVFKSNNSNMFQNGSATKYIGTATVNQDGTWSLTTNLIFPADMLTATATDTMGNTSEFSSTHILTVGINKNELSKDCNIYPMPVSSSFTLEYSIEKQTVLLISILSIDGKKIVDIYNQTVPQGDNLFTFNIDNLQLKSGMYLVKISDNKSAGKVLRFIKN